MPSFTKLFRSKDTNRKTSAPSANTNALSKPQWTDSWLRTRVDPEEVAELLHGCTRELKSRALGIPFLILPFRPSSDPSAARTFVRNYFLPTEGRARLKDEKLVAELKMTEVMVLVSVLKWCWARLPGGVISWETYNMFKIGEKDTHFARDAYSNFLPISVESKARVQIINDFFDLLASFAAHAKTNGLGGHKVSRYAGWWAFEHYDTGKGFDAGYKSWNNAADATSHMFFAYLRSLVPEPGKTNGIMDLPRSLQQLVAATPYPPPSSLLSNDTTKLVMIVDVVSPTPYALLRRAKNFEYRDDDRALRQFANHDDPIQALTNECRRVLKAISTTNQSHISDAKTSTSLADPSWSRFEDIGFSSALDEIGEDDSPSLFPMSSHSRPGMSSVNSQARNHVTDLNRPTTPSWADFLSSGFVNENGSNVSPILLPPDKILPPIMPQPIRGQSSQSHRRDLETASALEPGEVASITKVAIDDAFWWVWISSLAGEEPTSRKAVFGRCAYIETSLADGHWMIMEEQVKGAAPEPVPGAYIAEKKGFLGFTTKGGRLTRRRSGIKKSSLSPENYSRTDIDTSSRTTLAPDQQAKIRTAALELSKKKKAEEATKERASNRRNENEPQKTTSVYTLGPLMKDDMSPALQWAKQYDKNAIRTQYLGNELAGKGSMDFLNTAGMQKSTSTLVESRDRDLPPVPQDQAARTVSLTPPTVPEKMIHDVVTVPQVPEKSTHQPEVVAAEPPLLTTDNPAMVPEQEVEPVHLPLDPVRPSYERVETLPEISDSRPAPVAPIVPASVPDHVNKAGRSSPELRKKGPPQAGRQNGIKRLFGTMRKTREESERKPPVSPVESNSSVAAARRALEGKANPALPSDSPPLSPGHFNKYQSQSVKDRVAALTQTAPEPKTVPQAHSVEQAASGPAPAQTENVLQAPAEDNYSIATQEIGPEPGAESHREIGPQPLSQGQFPVQTHTERQRESPPLPLLQPHVQPQIQPHVLSQRQIQQHPIQHGGTDYVPPRTRRDAEFDQLSRVDTQEREQADHEFSRFDQGPLSDQPAFAPPDSPTKTEMDDEFEDASAFHQKHQSVYSAVTMHTDATDDESQSDLAKQISPNDRWAQIRRNAAERAARTSEDHGNRSRTETRTDDGETSGEETIESRVARIKARVAELTGNMEQTRR